MSRKIEISKSAEKKLIGIFNYLDEKWSKDVRIKFANKLVETLEAVRINPDMFPSSEINKSIHKCVVTKQISIFYRYNTQKITIVSIFDTRQNPVNVDKELKNYL